MKTRCLVADDLSVLREINNRCHPHDTFPSFKNFYSEILVITDNKDRIITAGGVEAIAEAITITDDQFSSHVRTTALHQLLRHMMLTCGRVHQDYLHAFVDGHDEAWNRAIKIVGFKSLNSDPFFLEV